MQKNKSKQFQINIEHLALQNVSSLFETKIKWRGLLLKKI